MRIKKHPFAKQRRTRAAPLVLWAAPRGTIFTTKHPADALVFVQCPFLFVPLNNIWLCAWRRLGLHVLVERRLFDRTVAQVVELGLTPTRQLQHLHILNQRVEDLKFHLKRVAFNRIPDRKRRTQTPVHLRDYNANHTTRVWPGPRLLVRDPDDRTRVKLWVLSVLATVVPFKKDGD